MKGHSRIVTLFIIGGLTFMLGVLNGWSNQFGVHASSVYQYHLHGRSIYLFLWAGLLENSSHLSECWLAPVHMQ